MKKITLASLALAGFLAGCATSTTPDVVTHYDQFTHFRTDLIPENLLDVPGEVREMIWLNASRVFRDFQDFDYYLDVNYQARAETGWLKIPPGATLTILADGKEMKFKSNGSMNTRRKDRDLVSEQAIYPISADELRAIANAKAVKVKVSGENGLVERDFGPLNFQRFKKFVTNYVEGEG
jgi:hypothetical protein